MIGSLFLALALFVGGNVLALLSVIPYPVLGVMLMFVGLQHAILVRDLRGWLNIAVAILIAVVTLTTSNLALGMAMGITLLQGQKLVGALRHLAAAHSRKGKVLEER